MSKYHHERYPTLTDGERHLLYNNIQYRHKLSCMLKRLLHKEKQLHGRKMVAKRVRALLYRRSLDPRGDPMYSRPAPWRCVIKADDIATLLRICDRYAQQKLRALKLELKKDHVTVKEFCEAYLFDEEYVQRLLNDGDAREYNSPKWQKEIDAINRHWEEELRKVKEAMKKEKDEEAQKKKVSTEKKEAPPIKDEKKTKSKKPKFRKSFDGLDEYE